MKASRLGMKKSDGLTPTVLLKRNRERGCRRCVHRNGLEDEADFKPNPGTVIAGRYLVISYLGEGMFSRVYECIDQIDESEQHVAIKVVRNDKSCLEAGLGEIRVLARMAQLFNSQGC